MVRKLYVGNLPFSVSENQLKELFTQFGTVESVKIVTDAYSGRSKGFGFVEMTTEQEASAAAQNLNGAELEGRSIKVDLARPKESRPRDSRGGGSSGGPRGGGDRRSNGGSSHRPTGGVGERRNRW